MPWVNFFLEMLNEAIKFLLILWVVLMIVCIYKGSLRNHSLAIFYGIL
jgi:hypothetical protein